MYKELFNVWSKDQKPQPKKGRAFPYRFGDAVRLVKKLNLVQFDNKRIAVRFENESREFYHGTPLLDFVPEEELAIFSLPEIRCTDNLKVIVELSLTKLSQLETKPKDSIHDSYYAAYITSPTEVVLTRIDRTLKLKKYRGDDKLSNARYTGSNSKESVLEEFTYNKGHKN